MKPGTPIALLVLLLILSRATLSAQQILQPSGERMKADVSLLASDSLQGREAGTPDEQKAAQYVALQMEQMGLRPKGSPGNGYLSPFRMNFPVIFREGTLKLNDEVFKYMEEFGATDLSAEGNITAPFVNMGRGPGDTRHHSRGDADPKGKVVILDISSSGRSRDANVRLNGITERVKAVVAAGAVAVILHNSSRKATEDVLFGSPFTPSLDVPVFYIARLPFNRVRKMTEGSCSLAISIDRSVSKPENVVGWINNGAAKTVVIGAHFDHVGITRSRKGEDHSQQIHNGADDNASGTALMLELARWAVNNESLKYNYIFAAFSAEEKGLFGSKAFCTLPGTDPAHIAYMLNLDMVGRMGCQGDSLSVLGIASSPVWEKLLDQVAHPGFALKRIKGAPPFSDHAPFLKKDIPVIYFTTGIHPDYHTPKDDTEFVNFKGMEDIVAYLREFIRAADALPEIPFHPINPLQHTRAYLQTF
jgi:aminopeptidase YwaD